MKSCIVCGEILSGSPLIVIDNMPKGAQNLPSISDKESDYGITVKLFRCNGCGLVQLDNEPVPYYRDVIRSGGYSRTMYKLRKKQYSEWVQLCSLSGKKIIEVGCGQGEFLEILAEFPVFPFGIEHNEELAAIANKKGLNVCVDYPEKEDWIFANGPFDGFMSFNYLEHQPNPKVYLKAISNNLVEGGVGLLTVPSFEYIMEENSYYEFVPDHLSYFTMDSLQLLLNSCGFEIIKKDRVNRDTLSVIVKKRSHLDIRSLLEKKESIEREINQLVNDAAHSNKSIAIWGASHQGFTLSSTTGLFGKVNYIIDSAPFKQGKLAPASHIPIISPENAIKKPTDIIIIVAPGYSDEIAHIIKNTYKTGTEVWTLMTDHLSFIGVI